MIDENMQNIGLSLSSDSLELNTFVHDVFSENHDTFSPKQIHSLYQSLQGKHDESGEISIVEIEEEEFNLAEVYGLPYEFTVLKNHPMTLRLWRLDRLFTLLSEYLRTNAIIIQRLVAKQNGEEVLLREGHNGDMFTAEYPFTEEWAEKSNAISVAYSGQASYISDLEGYDGPYWNCQYNKHILSEFCVPILNVDGNVTGTIDCESTERDHFTHEMQIQICKVAIDLGVIDPLFTEKNAPLTVLQKGVA